MRQFTRSGVRYLLVLSSCSVLFFSFYPARAVAQEAAQLVTLSKQVIDAKSPAEANLALDALTTLYFKESKFNECIDFLKSVVKQKKEVTGAAAYYCALTRYNQLKDLEVQQKWNEYFDQGNAFKEEVVSFSNESLAALSPDSALRLKAQVLLWKYYSDQQDPLASSALEGLGQAANLSVKDVADSNVLKSIADELFAAGEKPKAQELYRMYVQKLITLNTSDALLKEIAFGFYSEGNIDLSEAVFDAYIERIQKNLPKEQFVSALKEIASLFAYDGTKTADLQGKGPVYAEKVLSLLDSAGGEGVWDENMLYLRAYNLEKSRDFRGALKHLVTFINRFPQSVHNEEARFKSGIITAFVLGDSKGASVYFQELILNKTPSAYTAASFYQLGLLNQWQENFEKAKGFYNQVLTSVQENAADSKQLAEMRLKEIADTKPIEYNLKLFLDAALKSPDALSSAQSDVSAQPFASSKSQEVALSSQVPAPVSGCMEVQMNYIWSGYLGTAEPSVTQPGFKTQYPFSGTKVVNLVVTSASGAADYGIYMVDVQ